MTAEVPADTRDTRERLVDAAEELLARNGVQGVQTREIVAAAGQRNPSAVSYHFGSRDGLLRAVLSRRGAPLDVERGGRRDLLGASPSPRDLVACLVVPYAALLASPGGRSYLRIVAQLRGRFAVWRVESDEVTTQHLARVFDELEAGIEAEPAITRERVVALMMLLTGATAERARRVDGGDAVDLSHQEFVDNLVAMCAAVLAA